MISKNAHNVPFDTFFVEENITLFPECKPNTSEHLKVSELHTLYVESYGNPQGIPVICIHGGPGAGGSSAQARCFDLNHYFVVVYDQRGAKRSTPFAELRENNTQTLIEDIEAIRHHFHLDRWIVSGGSWGGCLALAYGQKHPQSCLGFILRGTFFAQHDDVDHILYQSRKTYPEYWEKMVEEFSEEEKKNLLAAFIFRLNDANLAVQLSAAKNLMFHDLSVATLMPNATLVEDILSDDRITLGVAKLFVHYASHDFFLEENALMRHIDVIKHLPAYIVHGRHDGLCPLSKAFDLHKAWPGSKLHIVEGAGHCSAEPGIQKALVAASEQLKDVLVSV